MIIDWNTVIVAVIAASPGLLALFVGIRKGRADAAEIITKASERVVTVIRGQLDETCEELEKINTQYSDLNRKYTDLNKKYSTLERDHSALKREHGKLRVSHENLSNEFDSIIAGAHVLHDQLIELDKTPRYVPPERRAHKDIGRGEQ